MQRPCLNFGSDQVGVLALNLLAGGACIGSTCSATHPGVSPSINNVTM